MLIILEVSQGSGYIIASLLPFFLNVLFQGFLGCGIGCHLSLTHSLWVELQFLRLVSRLVVLIPSVAPLGIESTRAA